MPSMTAWGGRHMSLHGIHCEHEKTCQCDYIFCLEPEDCMCTCGQCVTTCLLSHHAGYDLSQQHHRRSHRTGSHTNHYPDAPVLTSRRTPRCADHPTLASQDEINGLQHNVFSINTPLRRGCHHRSSTTNCPSNEQV